jgi:hypothetical protein
MGTATWSGSAPTSQTILLHINDADECHNLYGVGTSDTCFVFPSSGQRPTPTTTATATATPTGTPGHDPTATPTINPTPAGTPGGK